MESFIHADIFFFISTVALVFITLLLIVVFIYLINIMRIFYDIMKILRHKTKEISLKLDKIEEGIEDSMIARLVALLFTKSKKTKKRQ